MTPKLIVAEKRSVAAGIASDRIHERATGR
jgi:hypothetical protein